MLDMKQTEKAKGKIRVLKLNCETLRELDAGELKQAQGAARSGQSPGGCNRYSQPGRRRCYY